MGTNEPAPVLKKDLDKKFPTIVVSDEKLLSSQERWQYVVKPRVVECHDQIYQVRNSVNFENAWNVPNFYCYTTFNVFDQEDTTWSII